MPVHTRVRSEVGADCVLESQKSVPNDNLESLSAVSIPFRKSTKVLEWRVALVPMVTWEAEEVAMDTH